MKAKTRLQEQVESVNSARKRTQLAELRARGEDLVVMRYSPPWHKRHGEERQSTMAGAEVDLGLVSPTDNDVLDKINAIAEVLGVDGTDEQALRAAFERLFAPVEAARRRARARMTPQEIAKAREKRIDPTRYVATRDAIRRR